MLLRYSLCPAINVLLRLVFLRNDNSCTFEVEKVAKPSSARWLSPSIVGQNLNARTRLEVHLLWEGGHICCDDWALG